MKYQLKFGKYKGFTLGQVPLPYLEWLVTSADRLTLNERNFIGIHVKSRLQREARRKQDIAEELADISSTSDYGHFRYHCS